jgi:hypothetical protein
MKLETEEKADFSLGEYLRERFGSDVAVFRNAQDVIDYEATVAALRSTVIGAHYFGASWRWH